MALIKFVVSDGVRTISVGSDHKTDSEKSLHGTHTPTNHQGMGVTFLHRRSLNRDFVQSNRGLPQFSGSLRGLLLLFEIKPTQKPSAAGG